MDQIIQAGAQQNTQTSLQADTQSIEEMQEKIAATLGISDLPDNRQKELIDKATETLLQKIFLETVDKLTEEDRKTYLELIEKESQPEEIEKFLNEKITSFGDFRQKIVDDFVSGMKTAAN